MANLGTGPSGWGFIPTGPTQAVPLGATTVTFTVGQFVTSARYAPQCAFINIGAAAANSVAFVAFGTGITVSSTVGVPIVPMSQKKISGDPTGGILGGYEILSTGKSPVQVGVIGSVGTTTVFITPGEGHR